MDSYWCTLLIVDAVRIDDAREELMMTSNVNPFVTALAKGINKATRGTVDQKQGVAMASVAIVLMAQERHSDNVSYETFMRHCGGIHANAKEQPEAFKASWDYWTDLLSSERDGRDSIRFNPLTKDEAKDLDVADKREENDPIAARTRTLRFATSVAYALHSIGVDWSNVTSTKHLDMFSMSDDNMLKLFPKKEKTIAKSPYKMLVVDTFGTFTFKAVRAVGDDALVKARIKKAAPTPANRAVPVRDIVAKMGDTVENADPKAFDNATKLASFSALIKLIDALNDSNVAGHLDSKRVAPFREYIAEEMEKVTPKSAAA